MDENSLNDLTNKAQMLKGHAMKFKKRVEEVKNGGGAAPAPMRMAGAPPSASSINNETNLLNAKLAEIEAMKLDLENFKKFITEIDTDKYSAIVQEVDSLKELFGGSRSIMEVEEPIELDAPAKENEEPVAANN
jgi:hypothetical protein